MADWLKWKERWAGAKEKANLDDICPQVRARNNRIIWNDSRYEYNMWVWGRRPQVGAADN